MIIDRLDTGWFVKAGNVAGFVYRSGSVLMAVGRYLFTFSPRCNLGWRFGKRKDALGAWVFEIRVPFFEVYKSLWKEGK